MANSIDFNDLTAAAPYVIGSAPDNLTGYALYGSGQFEIRQRDVRQLELYSGSIAIFYHTSALVGAELIASVNLGVVSDYGGVGLIDSATGNGYYAQRERSSNRIYLFKLVAGAQGAQVGTHISNTAADNQKLTIELNPTTKDIKLYINDVQIGTTFNDATYNPNKPAVITQGLSIYSFSSDVVSAQSLTIGSDLTPEEERTDTCTGFADGAADISFAGVSVAVTIASGSFTWTVPSMSGGVVWPRLPSAGTTITLEQDDISANTTADITLPVDWQTLRENDEPGDEEDPNPVANFAGIVTDNDQYIGYHITLTTDDTGYFPTSNGYWISRNGAVQSNEFLIDGVTPALPRTDPFLFQDDSGLLTSHTITMTAAGLIVGGGLSVAGLSVTSLSNSGQSVSGL